MSLLITLGLGASQIPSSGTTPAINPTQYMYLTLPTVSVTPGPLYAQDVNGSFLLIDAHDHTPGKGKQVPVAGMNFNGNLLLNGFQVNNVDQLAFVIRAATVAGSTGILYASGQDLYFVDGTGAVIQLTAGHSVNVTGTGGWTGNYGAGGSTASYTTIGTVFALLSTSGQYGKLATGDLQLYKANTASAAPITILNPLTTTGAYSITLPVLTPALNTNVYPLMSVNDGAGNMVLKQNTPTGGSVWPPSGVAKIVVADTLGNLLANLQPDGSTITSTALGGTSPTLSVGVIQRANIAAQAVSLGQIDWTTLNAQMANLDINTGSAQTAYTSSNLSFTPSTNTQYSGKNCRPIRVFLNCYYGPGGLTFMRFYGTQPYMLVNINYNGNPAVAGGVQTEMKLNYSGASDVGPSSVIDYIIPPGTISSAAANYTVSWAQSGGNGSIYFVGRLTIVEL